MSPKTDFLKQSCPVCHIESGTQDWRVTSTPSAESLSFEELKPYWNGFFKKKVFFTYVRCGNCGLLYCPTFFNDKQLEILYAEMPDNTAGVPVDALRRTQAGYYGRFRRYVASSGAYLEVGPDIGLFTENVISELNFDEYWLFEPNRSVWPALKTKLGPAPHHLCSDMLGFDAVPDKSVSGAVMIHVLDHLIDPVRTLLHLRQKLKEQATLLLVTHDESSVLAGLTRSLWPAYCLQHPQLFNPGTIESLLSASGYKVIEVRKTYNHFPVMYLLKHLFWVAGARNISLPQLNRLVIPLKLGNILTVATVTCAEEGAL